VKSTWDPERGIPLLLGRVRKKKGLLTVLEISKTRGITRGLEEGGEMDKTKGKRGHQTIKRGVPTFGKKSARQNS